MENDLAKLFEPDAQALKREAWAVTCIGLEVAVVY
jgi:hypothetical protein